MKGSVRGNFDSSSFLKQVEEKNLHIYNVRILRNQKLIFQADWAPMERRDIHSVTKTFTSTAVGFAREEGILSLDEYVTDCFTDELPSNVSENLRKMQLVHLLTMTMGFGKPLLTMEERPEMKKMCRTGFAMCYPRKWRLFRGNDSSIIMRDPICSASCLSGAPERQLQNISLPGYLTRLELRT